MNRQEEVTSLEKVLKLTNLISELKEELQSLSDDYFEEDEPDEPTRITYTPNYPKITSTVKFLDVSLLPALVFWPWIFIYYFKIYKERQNDEINRIRNSDEYKQQCAAVDNEVRIKQNEEDQRYQSELQHYNDVLLPNYQKRLKKWEQAQEKEKSSVNSQIQQAESELSAIYADTKILPSQYRNIDAIQYIYDMISTSDYSIKEAIEFFEREQMRKAQEEYLYEQQRANDIAEMQNDTYYEEPHSTSQSGHGMLSSLAHSAINNAQNHSRSSLSSGNGKQSLWGTAMCPWGKKDDSGWTIRCNIGCPMWGRCGGKR